ncbi:hypothetical protein [Arthrobacter sp. AQ5-05]|uniref:hypothetical protein n=1 Tax=Arthrobacter sp. AQ5-05 TaxID=2184581 RepID=UPI0012B56B27|nr:hypothetical protein [Arthrobacter sp. AQ5-05]
MDWNWGAVNQIADEAIITVGIAVLIIRQFIWRSARLDRMLRMPTIVIGAGIVYLIIELAGGFAWVSADWLIIAELGLVAITGTAMGYATHFRKANDHLQYRLTWIGVILWAMFVVVLIGNFALASVLGANLAAATGLILLSFGINRLAAIIVVRHRALSLLSMKQDHAHNQEAC